MADEIAASGSRPTSHAALKDAIFDALSSESMFDLLHERGAIPHPDMAASRVSEEICASLEKVIKRERFDLSIRRNVPYSELGPTGHGDSRTIRRESTSQSAASLVTFDRAGRHPLHVLEVVGQWKQVECLELAHGLARLLRANRTFGVLRTTVQWAGLVCYHTHRGEPQEPPWFDLDGGRTLGDKIEADVKLGFRGESPARQEAVEPKVETFAFDRFGKPPYGNGTVTVALIEFNAFSARFQDGF